MNIIIFLENKNYVSIIHKKKKLQKVGK